MSRPVIVLFGDLASHLMIERGTGKNPDDEARHQIRSRAHNKPLLSEMIANALRDGWPTFKSEEIVKYVDPETKGMCDKRFSVLDRFPQSSSRVDGSKVLRVKDDYIARDEGEPVVSGHEVTKSSRLTENIKNIKAEIDKYDLQNRHRITVIYDQNGHTREALNDLPLTQDIIDAYRAAIGTGDLVLAISSDAERWATALVKLMEKILKPDTETGIRPKLVIVTTADTLRKAGVNIKKYGALEHSIRDILSAKEQSPVTEFLRYADDLVIVFRETGSLHIHNEKNRGRTAALHYCPNFDRIAQSDMRKYGRVPGKFAIFLSAIVKGLFTISQEVDASIGPNLSNDKAEIFAGSLRLAAVAYNRYFTAGLSFENPFESIETALIDNKDPKMAKECENPTSRSYLTCSLYLSESHVERPRTWARTSGFLARQDIHQKLREIVIDGPERVLSHDQPTDEKVDVSGKPWFPRSFINVPYVTFGNLTLLDTDEIAQHFELAKIIGKYLESPEWRTPLSISVFGKPGSGKSFAVNQILKSVDPGRKGEALTFNLAQFSSADQLTEAFHQIQDRALVSQEVPLAVFDEFDAFCDMKPLGWLKYFLAPMQDGLFRGKSGDYRVGRAIFLFSGGTKHRYEEFANAISDRKPQNQHTDDAKVTDFLSRLKGYLNVSDINESRKDTHPHLAKLRRAALLRTLLKSNAKPIMVEYSDGRVHARIHDDIIDSFLNANYVHGVRSMEAIIQMSSWIDGHFVPASLPSQEQLRIHVRGDFLFTSHTARSNSNAVAADKV
ncbi:hypothetical protein [Paraburkholderia caballeronis]|uniref:hypothetical protein n=1 Tax=Paraburkholderia caballeronis TaxID=416943 RepID=UPI001066C463|nr:hypothetical protein [Paraburkholderia caballeronis]TDV13954.1 hypothetical protein C7408_109124 [Paraburkholderia caballeronis]TDV15467.1 hypothetical protein C7406_110123 [Paraburkholderia caballeronis]TDV24935.1 hypothetical protein C7404_109124 [Paraburkholderia caballeronis]